MSVLGRSLGSPAGRLLLDVAGGTGNYAAAMARLGFRVRVVDAEFQMLRRAVPKVGTGRCIAGDAHALPIADEAVDCAMVVNAVHLFEDPGRAFREARRVLRAGPLLVTAFTRENLMALFVYEYFGVDVPITARPTSSEMEHALRRAGFARVAREVYVYRDVADGSLNALHTDPVRLADSASLRNTSFWHRLDRGVRRRGMAALRRDLRSGALARRVAENLVLAREHGHGTAFAAWP